MAEEEEKKTDREARENKRRHENPPSLEWVIAGIGFLLVAGAMGFLLYRALTEKKEPPNFSVAVNSIVLTEGGYLVKYRLKNSGDATAAAVTLEGELRSGTESVEKSTATLTYAPSHSEREGGLLFTNDPQKLELKIRVTGYEQP